VGSDAEAGRPAELAKVAEALRAGIARIGVGAGIARSGAVAGLTGAASSAGVSIAGGPAIGIGSMPCMPAIGIGIGIGIGMPCMPAIGIGMPCMPEANMALVDEGSLTGSDGSDGKDGSCKTSM